MELAAAMVDVAEPALKVEEVGATGAGLSVKGSLLEDGVVW